MADEAKIVLAVSGSIAAFKSAKLASDLVSQAFRVRVVMTDGGAHFVTPLTFQAITGAAVASDVWSEQAGSSGMGHLDLARWADLLVVAPASAGTMARLALGLVDDLLGAVAISTRAPLLIAPAMESGMWLHPSTQEHRRVLRERGATFVGPRVGRLASGVSGVGRMAEPDDILSAIRAKISRCNDLRGVKVLITAGPTHEPIDPVRFIGNHSSGKMGYALATDAFSRGADVVLIAGPTALEDPPGVDTIHVQTADQMEKAVLDNIVDRSVIVMAAAVADFAPVSVQASKMKRGTLMTLNLQSTSDISQKISRLAPAALHVGFALETDNLVSSAREKMLRKGQHLVVANRISNEHNPMGSEENIVTLVRRDDEIELPRMPKRDVAHAVWDDIRRLLAKRQPIGHQ